MLELTNTEEMIMKCLWKIGKDAAVADLLDSLKEQYDKEYARTTISVFMSYLRDKGYVAYEKKSHAYVYHPLVDEQTYLKELLNRYLSRYFHDSVPEFLDAVLKVRDLSKAECEEMIGTIEKAIPAAE